MQGIKVVVVAESRSGDSAGNKQHGVLQGRLLHATPLAAQVFAMTVQKKATLAEVAYLSAESPTRDSAAFFNTVKSTSFKAE